MATKVPDSDRVTRRSDNGQRVRHRLDALSDIDFANLIGAVAHHFWGASNKKLSSRGELRFGTRGSRSVDLTSGTWFDHERNEGGGVLDLVVRETSCGDHRSAMRWLREHKFVDDGRSSLGQIVA